MQKITALIFISLYSIASPTTPQDKVDEEIQRFMDKRIYEILPKNEAVKVEKAIQQIESNTKSIEDFNPEKTTFKFLEKITSGNLDFLYDDPNFKSVAITRHIERLTKIILQIFEPLVKQWNNGKQGQEEKKSITKLHKELEDELNLLRKHKSRMSAPLLVRFAEVSNFLRKLTN